MKLFPNDFEFQFCEMLCLSMGNFTCFRTQMGIKEKFLHLQNLNRPHAMPPSDGAAFMKAALITHRPD